MMELCVSLFETKRRTDLSNSRLLLAYFLDTSGLSSMETSSRYSCFLKGPVRRRSTIIITMFKLNEHVCFIGSAMAARYAALIQVICTPTNHYTGCLEW